MSKSYGLLVMHREKATRVPYFVIWDDLLADLQSVICEADEIEQTRGRGGMFYDVPKPEAIFEYDSETGLFATAVSHRELSKLLVEMQHTREQQRLDDLSDAQRQGEDRATRAEDMRQNERDAS